MGKTKIIVAFGIVSTFVLGVVIAPVPSLAGENCMAKLVGSKAVAPGFRLQRPNLPTDRQTQSAGPLRRGFGHISSTSLPRTQ